MTFNPAQFDSNHETDGLNLSQVGLIEPGKATNQPHRVNNYV